MTHCRHFGVCGGCAVESRHAIDKPALLKAALAQAGFSSPALSPLVETPLQTRRRADLAVSRKGAELALGLHRHRGATVVDMQECVLLLPEILLLLPALRALLRSLQALKSAGAVLINWLDTGPDILLRLDAPFTRPDKTRIIAFAQKHGAPRISIALGAEPPEPLVILNAAVITFGRIAVAPPPGGFLQASAAGEAAILAATLAGLPKFNKKSLIIELFAGAGTLSFPLARQARIEAYEGDPAAAAAQDAAIRASHLAGRMSITQRDLNRRPLQAAELAKAAVVVLDPPFAGAARQMPFLAASGIGRIIYISCNPDALAQDAAHLQRAGYALMSAVPIDQFPYSENVEAVVVFTK